MRKYCSSLRGGRGRRSGVRQLEALEARQLLSASVAQIAKALDLPDGVSVTYTGNSQSVEFRKRAESSSLLGFPSGRDEDFLMMSTGIAAQIDTLGNSGGNQGTDLGAVGAAGDAASISFTLTVPASSIPQKVKFDFMFLSEEYPEYVGSKFNDVFTATVNGVNVAKDLDGKIVDVNNVFFVGLTSSGTFFDGRTNLLTATYMVPAGVTSVPIVFSIADVGDGVYDSAVLLDNVRFETTQVVYLNFAGKTGLTFGGATWDMPAFAATDVGYPDNSNVQAVIDALVAHVQSLYEGFDILFTTTKPSSGDYSTINIGGDDSAINTTPGSTLFGQGDTVDIGNLLHTDNAVVFPKEFGDFYAGETAEMITARLGITLAHELGHILGVRHVSNSYTDDVMKKNSPRDATSTFSTDLRELPLSENWPDAAGKQNDKGYLTSVLGTTNGVQALGDAWSWLKDLVGGWLTLNFDASVPAIYNVQIGTYGAGSVVDGELDADIAPQIVKIPKLTGSQKIFLPNFTGSDGFFLIGSSKPNGPLDITTGQLDAAGKVSFAGATVDYLDDSGKPLTGLTIKKKTAAGLQTLTSLSLFSTALVKNTGTFFDTDGDSYTIKLTGPGTVSFAMNDSDGDGRGPIAQLDLTGTTAKSALTVTVKKGKNGNGIVTIGKITADAGLGSITAAASDLTGAGLLMGSGYLNTLKLRNVAAGAAIQVGGAGKGTTVTLGLVGNNASMSFTAPVATLQAVSIGTGSIVATSIGTLKVTGAKNVSGDLKANVNLTGPAGTTVLGTATIAGDFTGATIHAVAGNIGSVTTAAITNATIYAGYAGPGLPAVLGDLTATASIKSVTVSGVKGRTFSASNSNVVAANIGSITVTDPDPTSGSTIFGVAADKIGKATVSFIDPTTHKRVKVSATKLDDPADSDSVANATLRLL